MSFGGDSRPESVVRRLLPERPESRIPAVHDDRHRGDGFGRAHVRSPRRGAL